MEYTLEKTIWTEKYRPSSLDAIYGQHHIIPILKKFVEKGDIPHLLFSGQQGVGKTATAIAIAKELFGNKWRLNWLEINASDERSIQTIRETVKNNARIAPATGTKFRIVFLDEADFLTAEAQAALRRIIERYSTSCRFILSCNNPAKIIDPIKDRCVEFRFSRLKDEDIIKLVTDIASKEGVHLTEDGATTIAKYSDGSARRAILILQTLSMYSDNSIDKSLVESYIPQIDRAGIRQLYDLCKSGDLKNARKQLLDLLYYKLLYPSEIIENLMNIIYDDSELSTSAKLYLLSKAGEIDRNINITNSPYLQLFSFISQIIVVWKKVKKK